MADSTITLFICPECGCYDVEPVGCEGGEVTEHDEVEMQAFEFIKRDAMKDALDAARAGAKVWFDHEAGPDGGESHVTVPLRGWTDLVFAIEPAEPLDWEAAS